MQFINKKFIKYSPLFLLYLAALPCYSQHSDSAITYSRKLIESNIFNGFSVPINLTILNTADDNFAPYYNYINNELLYNSIINDYSKYYLSKLELNLDGSFNFLTPHILQSPLNENRQNRAYFALIDNRQALVSAFNHTEHGSFMNVQKTSFERNAWSSPTIVAEFEDTSFSAHPTISPNGEMLIYSSNRGSADGTTHLWSCNKQPDGTWNMQLPIEELSSLGNEITPCFISDTLLIFASDGFEGMGGYDLYYSYYYAGVWSKPQPIDGINTEFNESDPAILPNGILLFSSDRAGSSGKLDLYSAQVLINKQFEDIQEEYFNISATTFSLQLTRQIQFDLAHHKITEQGLVDTIFSVEPQQVQFSIALDTNLIKTHIDDLDFRYILLCGKDGVNSVHSEQPLSIKNNEFYFDFSKFKEPMYGCDSLTLNVILDINGISYTKPITIELTNREQKKLTKHTVGNIDYYKVLTLNIKNFNNYIYENTDVLTQIKELSVYSNKINIIGNNLNTKFTSELVKFLNSKQPINIINSGNPGKKEYIEYQIFINR